MKILSKAALEKIALLQDESVSRLEGLLARPDYADGPRRERVEKNLARTRDFQFAAHKLASMAMASGRMQSVLLTRTELELLSLYSDWADSEV